MRLTDMADELYTAAADLPGGVRAATAKRGGVTVTRVEICLLYTSPSPRD